VRTALSLALVVAAGAGVAVWLDVLPMDVHLSREIAALLTPPAPPAVRSTEAALPVTVAIARTGDVPVYLSGIGTVQAYNTVAVTSRVDGQIAQVLFTEGQDVHEGDPLVIIDQRPYQALLGQAKATRVKDQATLDGALLDLTRYIDLAPKRFISRQQLDQQRALVDGLRAQIVNDDAQISYAQTQLDYSTIRSPIEGRVGIRQVDVGNVVRAAVAATLVTITQLRPISVVFTLPAGAVEQSHLTPGEVHVPVSAYAPDDTTLLDRGTIDLVDNTVDQSTGTIKLKASFPNEHLTLWPGNFVNGKLMVEMRHDAVSVPVSALRHGPRADFVWIVRQDDTVATRAVTTGQIDSGRVLVEKGLEDGERVVTDGYFRLDQNSKVQVVQKKAASRPTTQGTARSSASD
jgi:membrane fusion protein, multidrug efflux system